jgi:hypothetical protein
MGSLYLLQVNKHHTFQESRCFYVVSSDGTQTDFSYIKCLDNYVRKSYAEEPAELVSQMYFQRRNRDRAPAEASQATPAENSQATPQEVQLETPAPLAETSQATPHEAQMISGPDDVLGRGVEATEPVDCAVNKSRVSLEIEPQRVTMAPKLVCVHMSYTKVI